MRRFGLVLLLLTACASEDVVSAEPRLEAPERLDFGPVSVGTEAVRSLTLRNSGRGAAEVQASVTPPFAVEEDKVRVGGQSSRGLGISILAEEAGPREGVARLEWSGGTIEVALTAEAVEPQLCDPSDECRTVRFEPGKGCVEVWEPDGTPCERACLVDATCLQGKCTGSPLDCTDDDPCTLDFCDNMLGCQNIADPDRACETDDPCLVASCDPDGGCRFDPVVDGTPCGPATCGKSLVCIGGICSEEETPEGGACGEATPCRERGVCRDNECDQPPARLLRLGWSDGPIEGWTLHFDGVASPLGRIYWVECGQKTCSLASGQPASGGPTVRMPLFADSGVASRGRLLLSDGYLVSSYRRGFLDIRRADDLRREVELDLAELLPEDAWEWDVVELAAFEKRGFALVEARMAGEPVQGWVVGFEIPSGEIAWSVPMSGIFEGLMVDELGRLYFTWMHQDPSVGSAALISMTRAGGERWRTPMDFNAPLAVASGRLLDGNGDLRRLEDGAVEASLPTIIPLSSRSALMDFEWGIVFGYPLVQCEGGKLCPHWSPHLLGFDPWKTDLDWLVPVASGERWERTEPILTKEGSILFAQPGAPGDSAGSGCARVYVLDEFQLTDRSVREGFRCELPGFERGFNGPTALQGGMWVVANHCTQRIEAYPLGEDWEVADRGWVTAGGSPSGANHPR